MDSKTDISAGSFLNIIFGSEDPNSTCQIDKPINSARVRAQRKRRARERKALINCLYRKKKVIDKSCDSANGICASDPDISIKKENGLSVTVNEDTFIETGNNSFNRNVKKFKTVIEQLLSQKKAIIIKKCLSINGRKPFSSDAWKWFGEIRLFIPEEDVERLKIPYYKRLCGDEQAVICKHFVGCFFCSIIYMYDRRSTSTTTLCNHVSRYHVACNWPKECFQDCLQESSSMYASPTKISENLNPSEQNITIIDSVSVIKTEILDPSEENHNINMKDYSQCETTMPVIKTEILDEDETNQRLQLPNIKVETTLTNNTVDKSSRTEESSTSSISTKNILKNKESLLDVYPQGHLLSGNESPSIPQLPESCKKRALPDNRGFNHKIGTKRKTTSTCNNCLHDNKRATSNIDKTINHHEAIEENARSVLPNCDCVQEVALRKRSCGNHLDSVQQDDKNQLCSCMAGKITLTESTKLHDDQYMKKFYLEYPDFGKVTFNLW